MLAHVEGLRIMYPSGRWEGFWVQAHTGRQAMRQFTLTFANGQISGGGIDMVGWFIFMGEYDAASGKVRMLKQYLGKHSVVYIGEPDGEGSIQGTWLIGDNEKGPFLIRPVATRSPGDQPIQEIG